MGGSDYFEANPDHLSRGRIAVPLPTDASSEEIISLAQKDVSRLFGEENPQRLRYDAQFMFSDDFNLGDIPVWIVIIYDGHQAKWKGVYGYKGQAMSLVPFCQDFETYTTDGEDFFVHLLGGQWWRGARKAAMIATGEATQEQAQHWLSEWAPAYAQWAKEHPYAALHNILTEPMRDFMVR